MAPFNLSVTTVCETKLEELGAEFSAYGVVISWACENGLLGQVEEMLKLERNKGYQGIDIFLVMLAYFSSGAQTRGIRKFSRITRRVGPKLAALGGRDGWPTQASVSRALGAVDLDKARTFGKWLLGESLDYSPLCHHESVLDFDNLNEPWHVFDFDPTSTAVRQRALPEGEDLPEAQRLSDKMCAPGHPGRKRGEVTVSRPSVLHRGSRLWCGVDLQRGNPEWAGAVENAFSAVAEFAEAQKLLINRCIVCIDGQEGGWPQVKRGHESPARFLTRLTEYRALKEPGRLEMLAACDWRPVADSKSGPPRFAAEWGTLDIGGKPTRLVLSRFKNQGKKAGAGAVFGGWQYEVFATDLPPDAFGAPELITLYYARCGQENYFALEDRDLNLDHVFSYEPGGSLLASSIGLWLWNVQILLSWLTLDKEPERVDKAQKREPEAPEVKSEPGGGEFGGDPAEKPVEAQLKTLKDFCAWHVESRPGWGWDDALNAPICPAQHRLIEFIISPLDTDQSLLRFRASVSICRLCPKRAECTRSLRPNFVKEITMRVPSALVVQDAQNQKDGLRHQVASQVRPPDKSQPAPGPYRPRAAALKPQQLRHHFSDQCRDTRILVECKRAEPTAEQSQFMSASRADRQRRRKSWAERAAWNALNAEDKVQIEILAPSGIQRLFAPKLAKNAVAESG